MEDGRRRITLYDQMLAVGDGRNLTGGLTLNDVLTTHKNASPSPSPAVRLNGRTLLDIIREDVGKSPAGNRERKSWKFLRDRLRLNLRSHIPPPNSLRFAAFLSAEMTPNEAQSPESSSTVASAVPALRQISGRNSTRLSQNTPPSSEAINSGDPPENSNSAPTVAAAGSHLRPPQNATRLSVERRESFADSTEPAVAEQEANANEEEEEGSTAADTAAPVRMSLMDLLEETDRQMGLEGSQYKLEEEEGEEKEEDDDGGVTAVCGGGRERKCCVCMVRDKGAAFIPCGHTFCRLCSRELWVNRGNCPLCNGYILEILDIF